VTDDDLLADLIPLPRASEHARDEHEAERDLDAMGARTKRWEPGACDHRRQAAQVSESERRVYCGGCGVELDPIDVLARIASGNESVVYVRRRLRAEIDRLQHTLERLQRDERNAKSRIRNAKKRAGLEKRADGWPLCPVCGEDELGDLRNVVPDLKGELYCHRCARVTVRNGRAA